PREAARATRGGVEADAAGRVGPAPARGGRVDPAARAVAAVPAGWHARSGSGACPAHDARRSGGHTITADAALADAAHADGGRRRMREAVHLARRKVTGALAGPCVMVPSSSVPASFSVAANVLAIGSVSMVIRLPCCAIVTGSVSPPSSSLTARPPAVPSEWFSSVMTR